MKVLHLLDSLGIGGKERFTVSLASLQKAQGMEVSLLAMDATNAFAAELNRKEVPCRVMLRTKAWDFRLASNIRAMIAEEGFQILHCHNETAAIYAALTMPRLPCRIICTLHNGDRGGYSLKQRIENRLAFTRAWRLVAVSESIAESLSTREFMPASRVHVIENGIEGVQVPGASVLLDLRRELDLDPDAVVVACIGRLDPVKNHLGFLDAFAQVSAQAPRLALMLVGDGPMRAAIEKKIDDLGIRSRVRLTGFRSDIPALLALADIFALPSFQEGQSISLLEACSARKAVLASNRGGTPSIVTHDSSALLIDPDSRTSMSQALLKLYADEGLRKALASAAEAAYLGRFSLATCERNYRLLYEKASGVRKA